MLSFICRLGIVAGWGYECLGRGGYRSEDPSLRLLLVCWPAGGRHARTLCGRNEREVGIKFRNLGPSMHTRGTVGVSQHGKHRDSPCVIQRTMRVAESKSRPGEMFHPLPLVPRGHDELWYGSFTVHSFFEVFPRPSLRRAFLHSCLSISGFLMMIVGITLLWVMYLLGRVP